MKTSDINNLGNAYRSIYEAKTKEEVSDNKEFVPHMMYDPETGKGYKAEKPEDHERMSKMGYTHEEPDLVKEKKLPRQMLDPKKDVMVVKNNKVLVVDKSKEKEYLKKGWGLAEQIEEEKDKKNEGKKRFKRHDGIGKAKYTISYHDGKKKHKDGSDFFDIKIFKNEKDLSDFVGTLAKQGYKLTRESVIEEAKVLDNMSQLPYPDIERPLKSMQQVKKDADLGRMEITHIVKNKQGNKVVAAVVSNGKKNFVYVNNKGVAPLKEETLDEAKGKYASDAQMDDFLKGIENHPDVAKMSKHHNKPVEDIVKALRRMVMVNRLSGGNVYRLDFTDKDSKLKVKTKKQYAPTNEAVSPEQQAAIAINKKEKEKMKNEEVNEEQVDESLGALAGFALGRGITGRLAGAAIGHAAQKVAGPLVKTIARRGREKRLAKAVRKEKLNNEGSVKDLARQIDKVVAKMNKDSKLKPFAKKFASMAMDTMDIEKSLEKSLPSNIDGAKMIGLLEGKTKSEDASQFVAAARQAKKDGKDTFIFADKEYPVTCKEVEEAEKKLDPVDDAANDKKFKDRKDKDIDNDGDVDSSDEYLHNRRAKVDDAIDGGKKPAKKEEDDKKKVVAKSPKVAEISKIGEEFIAMLEAAVKPDEKLKSDGKDKDGKELSKDALDDEEIDEKEPKKGKEFIKKHDGSDKDIEDMEQDSHDTTFKVASNSTKAKSGKRSVDSPSGDSKVVNPVKEGTSVSLVDQARAHLAGEKNPHLFGKEEPKVKKEINHFDGRTRLAREFMQRMDKRRGVTHDKKEVK